MYNFLNQITVRIILRDFYVVKLSIGQTNLTAHSNGILAIFSIGPDVRKPRIYTHKMYLSKSCDDDALKKKHQLI